MEITLFRLCWCSSSRVLRVWSRYLMNFSSTVPLIASYADRRRSRRYETGNIIGGTLEMIALGWMNIGRR